MRDWAGPLATLGGVLSLAFWTVVPHTVHNSYIVPNQNGLYAVLVGFSIAGVVGGLLAKSRPGLAAVLMALGAVAGAGALALPGLLLAIAALVALTSVGSTSRRQEPPFKAKDG